MSEYNNVHEGELRRWATGLLNTQFRLPERSLVSCGRVSKSQRQRVEIADRVADRVVTYWVRMGGQMTEHDAREQAAIVAKQVSARKVGWLGLALAPLLKLFLLNLAERMAVHVFLNLLDRFRSGDSSEWSAGFTLGDPETDG